jgi:hypothetical protein
MKIGQKFKYKSHNKIRCALFLEENNNEIKAICFGDLKSQGVKIKIQKNQIL